MQFRALTIFAALVIAVTAAPAEVVARQAEDTAVAAPELDARTVTQGTCKPAKNGLSTSGSCFTATNGEDRACSEAWRCTGEGHTCSINNRRPFYVVCS